MTTAHELPALPFGQTGPIGVPPQLLALQTETPVARVRTPAGDEAWLVTRHEDVRRLYSDDRLGMAHRDPEHAPRVSASAWYGGPVGNFETEHADRVRQRSLLLPYFLPRRMAKMRPRVAALTDQLLDALADQGPPADLRTTLSIPLAAVVVCELLGVPASDQPKFLAWSEEIRDLSDSERSLKGVVELFGYTCELVAAKRAHPGDDVISALCAAENGTLDDGSVAHLASVLIFAGNETTIARTELAVLLMLATPGLRDTLATEPGCVPDAVEEILRVGITGPGALRYAREEIRLHDVTIAAGDLVLLCNASANYDERVFPDPERLDACRKPYGHLSFGHGPHYCIGAPLARIVLETVLTRLPARFQALRLAVPVEQLRTRTGLAQGLEELPVIW